MALEELDAIAKRVGDIHIPAIVPEGSIVARGGVVVQRDEVADLLDLA